MLQLELQDKLLNSKNNVIENFVQGKIWRTIVKNHPGKIVLPYNMYNDDVEIASVQGHNTTKNMMSVFTLDFPLLADHKKSKVEFMFPVAFARTSVTKLSKKDECLGFFFDEMNDVGENGIDLLINGEIKRVHFIFGLTLGDNKAIHELTGFSEGFNDEYICRNCIMNKKDRRSAVEENISLLRKPEDYETHVQSKSFGIKRDCNLNNIYSFHVTRNFYHDVFHDVLLTVLKDGIQAVLDKRIQEKKYTVQQLQNCFQKFDYSDIDSETNKLNSSIFNSKGILRLTGSECLQMIKYFTLVLGHFYDSENEQDKEVVQYVNSLEEFVSLCLAESFTPEKLEKLKSATKKHHTIYMRIFKIKKYIKNADGHKEEQIISVYLKPKHHHALHYLLTILNSGPLKKMWTMRLESHLREVIKIMKTSLTRVNPALTLCKKYALKLALFISQHKDGLFPIIERGVQQLFDYDNMVYRNFIRSSDILNVTEKNMLKFNSVVFKGTTYKSNGNYFVVQKEIDTFKLYKIVDIIGEENETDEIFLVLEKHLIDYFDDHLNAHVVNEQKTNSYYIIDIKKCGKPLNLITVNNNRKVIKFNKHLYD